MNKFEKTEEKKVVDLLAYDGDEFIIKSYKKVLMREVDAEGLIYYRARLEAGIGKIEILSQLRLSKEGATKRPALTDIDEKIFAYRLKKVPILGLILKLLDSKSESAKRFNVIENKLAQLNSNINSGFKNLTNESIAPKKTELAFQQNTKLTSVVVSNLSNDESSPHRQQNTKTYDPIRDRYNDKLKNISERFTRSNLPPAEDNSDVIISIVMPTYKVPLKYLKAAVDSVINQTNKSWELCIVDDGSNDVELAFYLNSASKNDERIKTKILDKNCGISTATNVAISMCSGRYVGFLDNDDMLTNDAVQFVIDEIVRFPSADLIYSDECKLDQHGNPTEIFSKPDFSPLALVSCMYTGHFSVYKKEILEKVGHLRSEYDFSQDYDLALRVFEHASCVRHIDKVLYGWRMIPGSGAQGEKPYARLSNIAALQDAAVRRNITAEACAEPAANHLRVPIATLVEKVSIVIPSDSIKNIIDTVNSIIKNTRYKKYEILVVTNSKIIAEMKKLENFINVIKVPFDKPFNFSEKCNVGAKKASGGIVIFYNDDVRVVSNDWVEVILECFLHQNVGIVGPKLLYENYLIQHAGMVTGVRGLVGTAFHCLPHESDKHFSMSQWMRDVSLICGACLAIRRDLFESIGGFDAVNAPISHSDVDLCFKVRNAGYSCIYTPFATMIHIGHQSIAEVELIEKKNKTPKPKDKSDIYLLRRWGFYTSYDPYFPPEMRDILYHDSPESWNLHANVPPAPAGGKDVLLVSHDLSGSGAPRIVFEMARVLREAGNFVVVASPVDGVFRKKLNEIGIPVIIDELLLAQHNSLERFALNFDFVIANTVVTWPVVKQLGKTMDVYWYIHEISLLEHLIRENSELTEIFSASKRIWAGSEHAARIIRPYCPDVKIIKYGVKPLEVRPNYRSPLAPLRISIFGSYEPRKGQDLVVAGFKLLPDEYKQKIRLNLFGRVLDEYFFRSVEVLAREMHQITIKAEIPYEAYREELLNSDIILVASRDDTLPFVSIDALGAQKVLICTKTTGTSNYMTDGIDGFIANAPDPTAISLVLKSVVDMRDHLDQIAEKGKKLFDEEFSEGAFVKDFLQACDINK